MGLRNILSRIRYVNCLVLLCLVGFTVVRANAPVSTQEELNAVGVLSVYGNGWIPLCTIFAVGKTQDRTYFVTAGHCISPRLIYKIGPGIYSDAYIAYPIFNSPKIDMGRFEIRESLEVPILKLADKDPELGENVRTIGFSGMTVKYALEGKVVHAASHETDGIVHVILNGVGPGASGSPLFCGDKVCGIIVGVYKNSGVIAVEPVSGWGEGIQ